MRTRNEKKHPPNSWNTESFLRSPFTGHPVYSLRFLPHSLDRIPCLALVKPVPLPSYVPASRISRFLLSFVTSVRPFGARRFLVSVTAVPARGARTYIQERARIRPCHDNTRLTRIVGSAIVSPRRGGNEKKTHSALFRGTHVRTRKADVRPRGCCSRRENHAGPVHQRETPFFSIRLIHSNLNGMVMYMYVFARRKEKRSSILHK